jgi:deoxyribodipyrimidine photo-lyase
MQDFMTDGPLILWFRRDLRLVDHPMLTAAVASGRSLIPVFILDPQTEAIGAAAKWRLGLSLAAFDDALRGLGSRLVFRQGEALDVLQGMIAETGAAGVHWSRLYDPAGVARDTGVKAALKGRVEAVSHPGHLLHEPHTVQTGTGGFYRVYTPYWRAVKGRDVALPAPAPKALRPPHVWPASDALADWQLGAAMRRGADVVRPYQRVGEAAALDRLHWFLSGPVQDYDTARNLCGVDGTSGLSQNLALGEIGPRTVWHGGMRAVHEGRAGAETFCKEIVWREFAYHLMFHTPHITTGNWKPEWDTFPWRGDNPDAMRWRRGMTGEPFVDAAMREMYVTGTMHNRGRMIVASYLTKHLMTDWRVGMAWFDDCLTDWDPASNAMGWQWAAGSGPDAAPYFRVFNPATQAEKFDAGAVYRKRFIAELSPRPGAQALSYFDAVPREWALDAGQRYPMPLIDLGEGRARALKAYGERNS